MTIQKLIRKQWTEDFLERGIWGYFQFGLSGSKNISLFNYSSSVSVEDAINTIC